MREYSRLFRMGRDCSGDSITRFSGVRLYMPALSEKIINHNTQQECLWEPPRWLAVFLTQLVDMVMDDHGQKTQIQK